MIMNLQKVVDQDPLAQLYEEDKSLIWEMRYMYTGWLVMSSIYYKLVMAAESLYACAMKLH